MKKTLIWVGVLTLAAGIGFYVKEKLDLTYKIQYDYKNFRTPLISKNKIVVTFDFIINNTGDLKESVRKINIDVYGNGVPVTKIYSDRQFDILPNQRTVVPLQMIINPAVLYQNAGTIGSLGLDAMKLTLKGYISIVKLGIGFPLPFVYNTTYKEFMQG